MRNRKKGFNKLNYFFSGADFWLAGYFNAKYPLPIILFWYNQVTMRKISIYKMIVTAVAVEILIFAPVIYLLR